MLLFLFYLFSYSFVVSWRLFVDHVPTFASIPFLSNRLLIDEFSKYYMPATIVRMCSNKIMKNHEWIRSIVQTKYMKRISLKKKTFYEDNRETNESLSYWYVMNWEIWKVKKQNNCRFILMFFFNTALCFFLAKVICDFTVYYLILDIIYIIRVLFILFNIRYRIK